MNSTRLGKPCGKLASEVERVPVADMESVVTFLESCDFAVWKNDVNEWSYFDRRGEQTVRRVSPEKLKDFAFDLAMSRKGGVTS